jgi:hypothetical protein
LLVLVVVIPALLLATGLIFQAYQSKQDALTNKLLSTVRAIAGVADGKLNEARMILRSVAASGAMKRRDFTTFDDTVREALRGRRSQSHRHRPQRQSGEVHRRIRQPRHGAQQVLNRANEELVAQRNLETSARNVLEAGREASGACYFFAESAAGEPSRVSSTPAGHDWSFSPPTPVRPRCFRPKMASRPCESQTSPPGPATIPSRYDTSVVCQLSSVVGRLSSVVSHPSSAPPHLPIVFTIASKSASVSGSSRCAVAWRASATTAAVTGSASCPHERRT